MNTEKRFNFIVFSILFVFLSITSAFYILSSRLTHADDALIVLYFIACVIILLGAVGFIRVYTSKNILKPLRNIYQNISKLIKEKNICDLPEPKTADEIQEISDNFTKMVSALEFKIASLKEASEKEQNVIRSLAMLSEMMGFITSELTFETILQRFLAMARSLLKAEDSGIFLYEGAKKKELKFFKITSDIKGLTPLESAKEIADSTFGNIIKTSIPLRINEFTGKQPFNNVEIKNLLALPIASADNKMSAILFVINKTGGFNQDDEDTLFNFSFQAFQALAIHEELARLAVTDGLTGLNNHRAFQEKLSEEIMRAERYAGVVSLIIVDIDHFKSINDNYGHPVGDSILKEIARIINDATRNVDFTARYGGEEFVVIAPETKCEDAMIIAERIRLKTMEHQFASEQGDKILLTISAGVACYPFDAKTKEELINKTDAALYFAKNHGRNKIFSYEATVAGIAKEMPVEFDTILKDPSLKGIETIAKGIDMKSHYTKDHSLEVAAYAVMLAKSIRLDQSQIESLRIAGILHDIGNIGIPDRILNKPSTLTPEEKSIIQGHPGLAEMVLKKYPNIEDILPAILYHHERYDGNGYPLGLKGEEIPILARILTVAEAYQAMTSSRPYRRRFSDDEAIESLKKDAGRQFDPIIVNAFIELIRQKKQKSSDKNAALD